MREICPTCNGDPVYDDGSICTDCEGECMIGTDSSTAPKTKSELADFWQLSEDERHPEEDYE